MFDSDSWNLMVSEMKKYDFEKYVIPMLICYAQNGLDGKLIFDQFTKPYEVSIRDLIFEHFKEVEQFFGDAEKRMNEFLKKIKAAD